MRRPLALALLIGLASVEGRHAGATPQAFTVRPAPIAGPPAPADDRVANGLASLAGGWPDELQGPPSGRALLDALLDAGAPVRDGAWPTLLREYDVVHHRARWPVELPFAVWLDRPVWIERLVLTPRREGLRAVSVDGYLSFGLCGLGRGISSYELGALPLGEHEVVLDVALWRAGTPRPYPTGRAAAGAGQGPPPDWEGELTLPVLVVPTVAEARIRAESAEVERALRGGLRANWIARRPDGVGLVRRPVLALACELPRTRATDALAVRLRADVIRSGETVASFELEDRSFGAYSCTTSRVGFLSPRSRVLASNSWRLPTELAATGVLETCVLRVRGLPPERFPDWRHDAWWTGELLLPLTAVLARDAG